jgi:hypothetical protein
VEYQQIAVAWIFSWPSTDALCVLERSGGLMGGLVFGTLLGPEATGPGLSWLWLRRVWYLFVSGFLAAPIACVASFWGCVWGVWFGVVV